MNQQIHGLSCRFEIAEFSELAAALESERYDPQRLISLRMEAEEIALFDNFNTLLCLDQLPHIEKLSYQIETVRKVLRQLNGRALLADEVGLGKTIEAGLLIKEYLLRGFVERILILTPSSLVTQWQREMHEKFDVSFDIPPRGVATTAEFWQQTKLIVSSINLAKSRRNFPWVTETAFDLVVVDEAHHLKNASSLNWKLVNSLKKKYIVLLTATPLANNLLELYHLITLLTPGQLKTKSYFTAQFVTRGDIMKPRNRQRLRELLGEVMVRNTRSLVSIDLPRRWAETMRVAPHPEEAQLYDGITQFVRRHYRQPHDPVGRLALATLQQEAGSSPAALIHTLERLTERLRREGVPAGVLAEIAELTAATINVPRAAKAEKLLELIKRNPTEKIVVFVHYKQTLAWLADFLIKHQLPAVQFHGGMSAVQKEAAIEAFQTEVPVLLSTESGGEGRNLQFCRTLINFDLPWNPMRLEQRIGRLHRFGQTREVFIFNLALQRSVEDHLLKILDGKINMFELVLGEMGVLLGNLADTGDFAEIVLDIWAQKTEAEAQAKFAELGDKLITAKQQHETAQAIDQALFGEEFQS